MGNAAELASQAAVCAAAAPGLLQGGKASRARQLTSHQLLQLPHLLAGAHGASFQNLEVQEELSLLSPGSITAAAAEGKIHLCSASERTRC